MEISSSAFILFSLISFVVNLFLLLYVQKILQEKKILTQSYQKEVTFLEQQILTAKELEKERSNHIEILCQKVAAEQQETFLKLATSNLENNFKLWNEQQNLLASKQENKINQLVTPVKERLKEMDEHNRSLSERWMKTHSALTQSLTDHNGNIDTLRQQTHKLARTLYSSQDRGAWGEMQLKRIIELAGLEKFCDYTLQAPLKSAQGASLRPDALIHLPQGRHLLIDAKAPVHYDPEDPKSKDTELFHAQTLKKHIQILSSREYASALEGSPDFVILFVPTESILNRALRAQPSLFEVAAEKGVVLASPASLIAILKCIHMTWRHNALEENVQKAMDLCQTLLSRLTKLSSLFSELNKSITKTAQNFDQAMASYEKRVLPTARRLGELTALEPSIQKALNSDIAHKSEL